MNAQTLPAASDATPSLARQLVVRLSARLANEKRELVTFLVELADFDQKKLALELGYPSTFACLIRELGLTESSACRRIAAARLLARFPQIAQHLIASRLTLSGLAALKDVLDETNVDGLLERAAGLSEREVYQLVERIRFREAAASPSVEVAPGQLEVATAPAAAAAEDRVATSTTDAPREAAASPAEAPEALTLWVGREFREELAAVRALLSHAVPGGKREDVLLHVLRAQRKVLERRRYGSPKHRKAVATKAAVESASASAPEHASANARKLPAALEREVYEREGGCCAYVGEDGRRCGSTYQLEFQHIIPVARGGRSTADNLTLYCRAHNLWQAEKDFGEAHVRRKRLERSVASALVALGFKKREAEHAAIAAVAQFPDKRDAGALVRESLRLLAP